MKKITFLLSFLLFTFFSFQSFSQSITILPISELRAQGETQVAVVKNAGLEVGYVIFHSDRRTVAEGNYGSILANYYNLSNTQIGSTIDPLGGGNSSEYDNVYDWQLVTDNNLGMAASFEQGSKDATGFYTVNPVTGAFTEVLNERAASGLSHLNGSATVGILNNGNLIFVYANHYSGGGEITFDIINPSTGTTVINGVSVAAVASNPSVTTLSDGGFFISYAIGATTPFGTKGKRFNSSGTLVGSEITIFGNVATESNTTSTTLSNGNLIIQESGKAKIYDFSGGSTPVQVGGEIAIYPGNDALEKSCVIESFKNGGFVAVYVASDNVVFQNIGYRVYDNNGNSATTGQVAITTRADAVRVTEYPDVATFSDGSFIVSYGNNSGSTGTVPKIERAIVKNMHPVIDLDSNNSSGGTGSTYTASTLNGQTGGVAIADSDVLLTDADGEEINSIVITISNHLDGANEFLTLASATGITVSGSGTKTITLTDAGSATKANFQTALQNIKYENTSAANTTTRSVTLTVTDDDSLTATATTTIAITAASAGSSTAPTVTTTTASNIAPFSTTLAGNATADGGAPITEKGYVYSVTATNSNPLISGSDVNKITDGTGIGVYSELVGNLAPNTQYTFKAYATNSVGTSYGNALTFTTTAIPTPNISTNDIVVLQYNSDGGIDETAFLALANLSAGQVFYISDGSWNNLGPAFGNTSESGLRFTVGDSGISAGTIIRIDNPTEAKQVLENTSLGTLEYYELSGIIETSQELTLSTSGDQLVIFQTTDGLITSNKTYIYAFNSGYKATITDTNSDGWQDSGTALLSTSTDSHIPPGLIALDGTQSNKTSASAFALGGLKSQEIDNWQYTGPVTDTNRNNWLTRIHTLSNWGSSNDTPYNNNNIASGGNVVVTATTAPTITTTAQALITTASADLGGNVTSNGGATVTDRGIVWHTSTNPTTANNKVANGTGTGTFSAAVRSLPTNTTIYARAYAINSVGTSYGSNISFTTQQVASSNFTGLGANNSGGTGFKTNTNNTNYVISNIMKQDSDTKSIYIGDNSIGAKSYTIKVDGTNAESFSVDALNVKSYNGGGLRQVFDQTSTVVFKDKNGTTLQTMTLSADKELPFDAISLFTFFDSNNTTPVNNVAEIIVNVVPAVGAQNTENWTPTGITISNVVAPSTPLTISGLTGDNKVYDDTTVGSATGTASLSGVLGGDDVSLSGSPVFTFASANVGTGITITTTGYTLSGADAGKYTLTQPTLSANITAKELTITGITGSNKVYDGTTAGSATGTASLSGVESGDDVSLGGSPVFTFASANVGTGITINTTGYTISGTDSGNYTLTQPTLSANITAKQLIITGITGSNKVYDDSTAGSAIGTATLSGVVGADDVSLGGSPVFTFASANVGTGITINTSGYTISGTDSGNYTLTQPTLSGNITAKGLSITGITGNNKVYDDTTAGSATGTASLSGVESGDDVSLGGSPMFTFASANVGTGITINTSGYTISGTDSGNYTLTQPTLSANITAKQLTITGLTGSNKNYDGTTTGSATGTASLSGVESGDDVSLGGSPVFTFASANVGTGITINTTGYTISGTDSGNYTLTQPTLSANITAKQLIITGITGSNKVYDDSTAGSAIGTATLSGVVGADDVSLGGSPVFTFASANVGTGITINTSGYTISGTDSGNYTLTQPTLSGNITAKGLSITGITGNNKVYDDTTAGSATGTASLSGVESGDDVSLGGSPMFTFASANVGTGITINTSGYTISGTDSGNYTLTQPTLSANITAKQLTITGLTGSNKNYDGTTTGSATGTASLSGVESGDDVSLGGSPVFTFASANAGTGITINTTGYTISGTDSGNYTLTQPTLSADIITISPTITFTDIGKTYGDANFNLGATSNSGGTISYSIISGGTGSATLSGTQNETVTLGNAGTITVRATQAADGVYASATKDITLTIGKRAITVTADALQKKVSGEADPVFTYQITSGSLVNSDTFTGALSREVGELTGNYALQIGTLSAGSNYDITFVSNNFSIDLIVTTGHVGRSTISVIVTGKVAGGIGVIERGVVYSSTDTTPEIGEPGVIKVVDDTTTGDFIVPIYGLSPSTTYYYQSYVITSVAKSTTTPTLYGGVESFQTLATEPIVSTRNPTNGTLKVDPKLTISLSFDKDIKVGSGNIVIKKTSDDSIVETIDVTSGNITIKNNIFQINPTADLPQKTEIYVLIPIAGVKDLTDKDWTGFYTKTDWTFTTDDTTVPTVTNTNPLDNAVDISPSADITVTFDEDMQKGTGNILVKKSLDDSIIATLDVTSNEISITDNVITINPNTDLPSETEMYIQVPNTAFLDLYDNSYAGFTDKTIWNFTTADITSPTVNITGTKTIVTNTPFTATFTFSEDIKNFDLSDITLVNATASVFNKITDSKYTALITPSSEGLVNVSVLADKLQDLSNNNNILSNVFSIEYDITKPSLIITTDTTNPTNVTSFVATFTFSEDVDDFDETYFNITNGISSNFVVVSNSVFKATITPAADGLLTINTPAGETEDIAGNENTAGQYETLVDTVKPSVTITSDV